CQEARAVERVEMPLVIHAIGHLVTRVTAAQEQAQEPGPPKHRLRGVDERLVWHGEHGNAARFEYATDLMERGGRIREVLEHLGAVHALKRVRWEGQLDRIRLSQ